MSPQPPGSSGGGGRQRLCPECAAVALRLLGALRKDDNEDPTCRVRRMSGSRRGRPARRVSRPYVPSPRDATDVVDGEISLSPLNRAQLGPVISRSFGERLLRPSRRRSRRIFRPRTPGPPQVSRAASVARWGGAPFASRPHDNPLGSYRPPES
jgi:hypothetical protein